MNDLITIVVIGRNEEKNIARCIESCLNCDWPNKEIIYCDSESTDKTVEIARRYPLRVIIHSNERRVPSVGRNIGLKAANGKYVYFIDGDMTLESSFLKAAFPILISDKEIGCVVGVRKEIHKDNLYVRLIDSSYHYYPTFGEVPNPSGGGGLFKRDALLKAGGYFDDFFTSDEDAVGVKLRAVGFKTILIEQTMAYHDVGVYNIRNYLRFRIRQGRMLADTIIHREKILPNAYKLAVKQVLEFLLMILWVVGIIIAGSRRIDYILISMGFAFAWYLYKLYQIRNRDMRWLFFIHEYILGKPIHIISEIYYLIANLVTCKYVEQK